MDKKEKDISYGEILIKETNAISDYFKNEIEWLNKQEKMLCLLGDKIEAEINKLLSYVSTGKSTKVFADLVESLVSLRSQQQSCVTSAVSIKTKILDYTLKVRPKSADNDSDDMATQVKLMRELTVKMGQLTKNSKKVGIDIDNDDLDDKIDLILAGQ